MGRGEDIIHQDEANTLDGLLRVRIRRTPQGEAYRHFDKRGKVWRSISWEDVGREVGRWQAMLSGLNLQPGDRVALCLRNCPEWVYFEQAALGLGLVVIPLYTDDRPDNIAFILEDAAVKLLLLTDSTRWRRIAPALAAHSSLRTVLLLHGDSAQEQEEDERIAGCESLLPSTEAPLRGHANDPHALATIVYTSGTTGRSKGVMLSHSNILSIAHSGLTMVSIRPDDLFLSFLPLSHTLERTAGYYLPMMAGSTVAYARSTNQLAEDLQTVQPTVLISVPRIYERIYTRLRQQLAQGPAWRRWLFAAAVATGWQRFEREQGRRGWHPKLLLQPLLQRLVGAKIQQRLGGRLRIAVSGGAALPSEIAHIFLGLGVTVLQGYGLTETSPMISVNVPEDNEPSSVGVPLRGIEVRIGPDHELQVKSPGIMLGYWNNHTATAEMIGSDGWLGTGDQAHIDNGHIFITGRLKDILVLSNGEKVPPADMEMAIALEPLFEQVMVIGEGQSYLAALIVLNSELWPAFARECDVEPDDIASLRDKRVLSEVSRRITALLHDFPGYAKIRRLSLQLEPWSIDNGLLTPTLKVKRAKVLEHLHDEVSRLYQE